MIRQTTNQVLMIRPHHFGYNEETAQNNVFQRNDVITENLSELARKEFDHLVDKLRNENIHVKIFEDQKKNQLPDSVFPNNWISTHLNDAVITYPMFSRIRRQERREDVIKWLLDSKTSRRRYSFEHYEEEGEYLEGTGSLCLDRVNKISYACLSSRTFPLLVDKFCTLMNYDSVMFEAKTSAGQEIYHTNVMMAVGTQFVVIAMDTLHKEEEKEKVETAIRSTGKELISISEAQMNQFAGNIIELHDQSGQSKIVMSTAAYHAYTEDQIQLLEQFGKVVHSPIPTIEYYGGGSVRCMIAEIF